MIYEFNAQEQFMSSIAVDDIGNVTLKCTNQNGDVYYLNVQTAYGKTAITKFGPVADGINILFDNFALSYTKIDFKEAKINKEIKSLLNDPKKGITEAEPVALAEMWKALPGPAQFNLSESAEFLEEI